MFKHTRRLRLVLFAGLTLALTFAASAQAQTARDTQGYSDSGDTTRARTSRKGGETEPSRLLRAARTLYIEPNDYIDAKYLEYKLGKYPELAQWRLSIVKQPAKADLILSVHRTALNYIFSVEEPESSVVVVNGKVVAINGLVAAEDIAAEIIKRMKNLRALPDTD